MYAEAICQRSRQCMPHIHITSPWRLEAAISCGGSPENKALTSPYNGAEHKLGMFVFDFLLRPPVDMAPTLLASDGLCVYSQRVRAGLLGGFRARERARSPHGRDKGRRVGETKCGPLAFVIICQFSLRQLPLSSLSDLTQGSETVTRWQRHLSACAG